MVRRCLQLAAGTWLLVLANGQTSSSQFSAAVEATDECRDESCALELAQLRASKIVTKPNHKDASKAPKAKLVSKTDTNANTKAKATTKTGEKAKSKKTESKKTMSKKHHSGDAAHASYHHPAWLKDCKKVFLDLGANIGVNVRKLFEPKKYLGDQLEPYFQRHFGGPGWRRAPAKKSNLCALAFEPNPEHMPRLKEIEKAYKKNGWHVHFYNYAIWREEGQMTFNNTAIRDSSADLTAEGAHLNMRETSAEVSLVEDEAVVSKVRTINFADFIGTIPKGTVKLVLMDIEGAEYETMAQLMAEKKLCRNWIWNLLVEAHTWGEITHWGKPESFTPGIHPRSMLAIRERVNQMNDMKWCGDDDNVTYVAKLDDETFQKDVDNSFGQNRR